MAHLFKNPASCASTGAYPFPIRSLCHLKFRAVRLTTRLGPKVANFPRYLAWLLILSSYSPGYTYPQIAQNVGSNEQRVRDSTFEPSYASLLACLHVVVVSGKARPTQQEFNNLARSLDIQSPAVSGRT